MVHFHEVLPTSKRHGWINSEAICKSCSSSLFFFAQTDRRENSPAYFLGFIARVSLWLSTELHRVILNFSCIGMMAAAEFADTILTFRAVSAMIVVFAILSSVYSWIVGR